MVVRCRIQAAEQAEDPCLAQPLRRLRVIPADLAELGLKLWLLEALQELRLGLEMIVRLSRLNLRVLHKPRLTLHLLRERRRLTPPEQLRPLQSPGARPKVL